MKKRWIAALLALVMVLTAVPVSIFAAAADIVTITVLDDNGDPVEDATVTVVRTYRQGSGFTRRENVTVTNNGDGTYTYDTSKYTKGTTQIFSVTVEKISGTNTYTESVQLAASARAAVVTLEGFIPPQQWETYDVYYIADGHFPNTFYGYGDAADYGPGRNDTPLLTINVNTTELRSSKYANVVLYQENVENAYHFIPAIKSYNPDPVKAYEENLDYTKAFWEAVVACMDEASVAAFKATGLFGTFAAYCLKNQGSAGNPDRHCDGILTVEPPVYVIEMYDHKNEIFGGFTDDAKDFEEDTFTTMEDVLKAYNDHFGQDVDWHQEAGTWTGSYITTDAYGRKFRYDLQIVQTNYAYATTNPAEDGGITDNHILYQEKTETYYLAMFQSATEEPEQVAFTVTYTDGLVENVFNDQVTAHNAGQAVPNFNGNTYRENFVFLGWVLEGGNGEILSQEDILRQYTNITRDMTFVAVYEVAPEKYNAIVETIVDGSYNSYTGTATGERVDIDVIKAGVSLYISADGVNYIPLEKTATGTYSAKVENGTYQIYFYNGTTYKLASEQLLNINNADRTRYLFFNSVTYVLNGGVGGPDPLKNYYITGSKVYVETEEPTLEGYIFKGWKNVYGQVYAPGSLLSSSIGTSEILTAQWEKRRVADVNVTLHIKHYTMNGQGVDPHPESGDLMINLVYRANENEPYVEVVGGAYSVVDGNWYEKGVHTGTEQRPETTVTYTGVFEDLSIDYLYSANLFLDDYYIINRTVTAETDAQGNITYSVEAELMYEPTLFTLTYQTVAHESIPDEWIPKAVDVKVVSWDAQMAGLWAPISRHMDYSADVEFVGRTGEGSYQVPVYRDTKGNLYYYRAVPVGFTLADGTELTATPNADGTIWYSDAGNGYPAGAFRAEVTVTGGAEVSGTSLTGVYGIDDPSTDDITKYLQVGNITITVYANLYDVQFLPNGGALNGKTDATLVEDQMFVPNLEDYIPVRDGGYVFDGWYLADENGNMTQQTVTSGAALTSDITLIAKWKEPLTVEGLLTVGATYEQVNADGSVTIQKIHDIDFSRSALVILQRVDPNGYTETVREMKVDLTYYNEAYYFQGRNVGYGYYSFTEIPDDGAQYRVQLLLPNHHPTFQNEDESVDPEKMLAYNTYTDTEEDYIALWGSTEPSVATVNIHCHFDSETFELEYKVDSTQIGNGFRPESVEILVTYDGQLGNVVPSTWPVISQMIINGNMVGNSVALTDGIGGGSDDVWIGRSDGRTYYQYGIRVYNTTTGGIKTAFGENAPFTVYYQDPAYFTGEGQSQDLIATLVPKNYNISYVTNGGAMPAEYPSTHTWSYETDISGVVPTFNGFQFLGWYYDEAFTQPADDVVAASVAENVTLYAKWLQVMDTVDLTVIIHHTQLDNPDGLASNFDKTLYTQLTYAPRGEENAERIYADMPGYSRNYPDGQWHTNGDKVLTDIFQVPKYYSHLSSAYDYSANVKLDGYYISSKEVEKIEQPDGSTLHQITVELQYYPDLFDLEFYVEMDKSVPMEAYPESAEVKVTFWGDHPSLDIGWGWNTITQHEKTTITVTIDPLTGFGTGSYPVWHWYNEEEGDPYHYRIEVVQLNMPDGSIIAMDEKLADVRYAGGGYTAQIIADEEDCAIPEVPLDENGQPQDMTTLAGVYAEKDGDHHRQVGTVGAHIDLAKVVFHANLDAYTGNDEFRTYYPAGVVSVPNSFNLTEAGQVETFYAIPEFDYLTHNNYVFKGWYLDEDSEERPINWQSVYAGNVDVYAHWITVGWVDKEDDGKVTGSAQYAGFDLIGTQIRPYTVDNDDHYQGDSVTSGTRYSGLRFITVLSESVYEQINDLNGQNASGAEYGFVAAKSNTAAKYAGDTQGYTLQYKGKNVNGVDTTTTYKYVNNMVCSGVLDHYNGQAYRLYTAVITYNGLEGDALAAAQATPFVARSYIRYYDANGLLRTHYNNYNYVNTPCYNGCSTSYTDVAQLLGVQ